MTTGHFKEIDETPEHKDEKVHGEEKAPFPAGQACEQVFDPLVTLNTVKGKREDTASHKNEEHET